MPRRYYFAPVRGREGQIASGLASGITGGVENFERARHTAREVRRQDEADQRRRQMEDVEMDLLLRQMGELRGEAPDDEVTIRSDRASDNLPDMEMPEWEDAPNWDPNAGRDPKAPKAGDQFSSSQPRRAPDPGSMLSGELEFDPPEITLRRPDPRYMSVGDDFGYVMTPDALEERDYQRATGRREREIADTISRVGPMAEAIASGSMGPGEEGFGEAAIGMQARGFDPFAFLPPGEDERGGWTPNTREDYFRSRGRDPETGRLLDGGGGRSGGRDYGVPTYSEALEYLQSRYADLDEDGYVQGYLLSEEEMHELAREMASGVNPDMPPAPTNAPAPNPGPPEMRPSPGVGGWLERLLPFGEPGYEIAFPGEDVGIPPVDGPGRSTDRGRMRPDPGGDIALGDDEGPAASLSQDEVQAVREGLQSFPRRKWREILEEENEALPAEQRLSASEIDRILSGA